MRLKTNIFDIWFEVLEHIQSTFRIEIWINSMFTSTFPTSRTLGIGRGVREGTVKG